MSGEGSTVVVQTEEAAKVEAAAVETAAAEVTEQVKDSNDTAVEIAKVNADAAVQIAEAHAETEQSAIEASTEIATAVKREELEACQAQVTTLTGQVAELNSGIQSILTKLTPPVSEPPLNSPPNEGLEDPKAPKIENQEAPLEPKRKAKPHNWI